MTRCHRCDWQANPDGDQQEQAAEHAQASSHWLCHCGRSLAPEEPLTCERCLTDAREHLAGIRLLYEELPTHLGHLRSPVYDATPHGDDGPALPGGDVLVMLSGGSEGLADDGETVRDDDPTSIPFELHFWEKAWREDRGEPIDGKPMSTASVVRHAAAYLEVHARWAANNHPGFGAFADDMRRLHRTLERATARTDAREVAEAECLECGSELIRAVRPRLEGEPRREGTEQEGYQDGYTCTGCGRVYERHPAGYDAYAIALRQHMHVNPQEWASAELLAGWFGVSPTLLRVWKHRGLVETTTRYGETLYRMRCHVPEHQAQSA